MPTVRRAEVEWVGGFIDGEGKIVSTTTGALPELEVTWQARVDEDQTLTSPEELLAAAHASCFAMQFTSGLAGSGWDPEEMTVACEVTFEIGVGIIGSALTAQVTVDGLTDEQIYEIAQRAKIMCPISRALAGIDITLEMPDLMLDEDEDEEDEAVEGEVPAAAEE
jgi:osmotically inducible protein OsmC